jgi:hypothetical protein
MWKKQKPEASYQSKKNPERGNTRHKQEAKESRMRMQQMHHAPFGMCEYRV